MQEKLLNLVNIKIDAINRNIDNLNYFNSELERNTLNKNYIEEKLSLFGNNDILNFDGIAGNDFEKILTMIDSSVSEIFQDKACNYHGIMYIIQGIRQGISLDLTLEQTNAILKFVDGMRRKIDDLNDIITKLEESKKNLPQASLDALTNDLEKYQNIITKIEKNLYLNEIDEIIEVFDFSNISIEEKISLFEYVLKYNADIYNSNKKEEVEEKEEEDFSLNEIKVPEFHYEPINIVSEQNIELDEENEEKEEEFQVDNNLNFDVPTIELNDLKEEKKEVGNSLPVFENINIEPFSLPDINQIDKVLNNNIEESNLEIDNLNAIDLEENDLENANLNTVDLEEIIKKIDAKLKEMEEQEKQEKVPIQNEIINEPLPDMILENSNIEKEIEDDGMQEDEATDTAFNEVFSKYNLTSESLKQNISKNAFEVDELLSVLNNNNLLNLLSQNEKLLNSILVNNNSDKLTEVLGVIRENLSLNDNNYQVVLGIIIETMPSLLVDLKVIDSFLKNIEFFKEHQINLINLFDNYRELLIIDNSFLKENNLKIKSYGLSLNNDNVKYMLYNKHILKNLDYYVEAMGSEKGFLGKEEVFDGIEYITKHPYKLNGISNDTLMKLRYSTENNLKIFGSKPGILAGEIANPKVDLLNIPDDYKDLYFENEYGFIDRSEMEDLLVELGNINEFNMTISENISKLDSLYKISDVRYKIENILFSRIKTIRLYNFLLSKNIEAKNALIIALTYNSVIKKDEYEKLVNVITTMVEGGN